MAANIAFVMLLFTLMAVQSQEVPKWADVCFVVDVAPIGEIEINNTKILESKVSGLMKLIQDTSEEMLKTGNVRIAVMIAEVDIMGDRIVDFTDGNSTDAINRALDKLKSLRPVKDPSRYDHAISRIARARTSIAANPGNRPMAPDMMIWIAQYDETNWDDDDHTELTRWRDVDTEKGPEMVMGLLGFRHHYFNLTMIVDRAKLDRRYRMMDAASVLDVVMELLDKCKSDVRTTPAYYGDPEQLTCHRNISYVPRPDQEPYYDKYCINGTIVEDKPPWDCNDQCQDGTGTIVIPCNAECGQSGTRERKPFNSSKLFQYCVREDKRTEPCVGPPCNATTTTTTPTTTTTTTSTTTSSTPSTTDVILEPWQIAVLSVAGGTILTILIGFLICFIRVRSKKGRDSRHLKHIHPTFGEEVGPTNYMGAAGGSRRDRSRNRSPSMLRGSSRRPAYLSVATGRTKRTSPSKR